MTSPWTTTHYDHEGASRKELIAGENLTILSLFFFLRTYFLLSSLTFIPSSALFTPVFFTVLYISRSIGYVYVVEFCCCRPSGLLSGLLFRSIFLPLLL